GKWSSRGPKDDGVDTQGGTPMTTVIDPAPAEPKVVATTSAGRVRQGLTNPVASSIAIVIGVLWTIPTIGLLVQSFRSKTGQDTKGWWTFSDLTFSNYKRVLSGTGNLLPFVMNSIVIV